MAFNRQDTTPLYKEEAHKSSLRILLQHQLNMVLGNQLLVRDRTYNLHGGGGYGGFIRSEKKFSEYLFFFVVQSAKFCSGI